MNLSKLFELQRQLDAHIEKEHPRQEGEDRLAKKILSLMVELGELANEARFFKFWSNDQEPRTKVEVICSTCDGSGDENWPSSREYLLEGQTGLEYSKCEDCNGTGTLGYKNPLLEEYVDCLHFILSIGNEFGYKAEYLYVWDEELEGETVDVFIELMYWVSQISSNDKFKRRAAFRTVCYIFFNLGERLGFTWDQVEQAYLEKNAVNHQRQESGY